MGVPSVISRSSTRTEVIRPFCRLNVYAKVSPDTTITAESCQTFNSWPVFSGCLISRVAAVAAHAAKTPNRQIRSLFMTVCPTSVVNLEPLARSMGRLETDETALGCPFERRLVASSVEDGSGTLGAEDREANAGAVDAFHRK